MDGAFEMGDEIDEGEADDVYENVLAEIGMDYQEKDTVSAIF
jgi:hypothetical protein